MGTTPNHAFPYPEGNIVPYVHLDLKALAERIDAVLVDYVRPAGARFRTVASMAHGSGVWNLMPIDEKVAQYGEDVLTVSGRKVTVPAGVWAFAGQVTMSATDYHTAIFSGDSTWIAKADKATASLEASIATIRRFTSPAEVSLRVNASAILSNEIDSATKPFFLSIARVG